MTTLQTANATKTNIEKGMKTARKMISLIKKSPKGLTIYQLAKLTGRSSGTCLKAIQRSGVKLICKIEYDDSDFLSLKMKKRYSLVTKPL